MYCYSVEGIAMTVHTIEGVSQLVSLWMLSAHLRCNSDSKPAANSTICDVHKDKGASALWPSALTRLNLNALCSCFTPWSLARPSSLGTPSKVIMSNHDMIGRHCSPSPVCSEHVGGTERGIVYPLGAQVVTHAMLDNENLLLATVAGHALDTKLWRVTSVTMFPGVLDDRWQDMNTSLLTHPAMH